MEACVRCDLPTSFNEVTESYLHFSCEREWWEETGPYPKPVTMTVSDGSIHTIHRSVSGTATPDDDDPEFLRKRGVLT